MADRASNDGLYQLWTRLHHVAHVLSVARSLELARYNVSIAEAPVLVVVHDLKGKATPAEISRRITRKPHSVSGLLTRMEKKGLITKTKDGEVKNLVRISLTNKGLGTYRQVLKMESIREIMTVLSEEQKRELCHLLDNLGPPALNWLSSNTKVPFTLLD